MPNKNLNFFAKISIFFQNHLFLLVFSTIFALFCYIFTTFSRILRQNNAKYGATFWHKCRLYLWDMVAIAEDCRACAYANMFDGINVCAVTL
jgi:hypothetical protein